MTVLDYAFRSTPFAHQLAGFEGSRDAPAWALHWDPGTGKTKVLLDTAAYNYFAGRIDAILVIAPEIVNANWIRTELERHLPEQCAALGLAWASDKAKTKTQQRAQERVLGYRAGLPILSMTYDGAMTRAGHDLIAKYLKQRRVLMILDEAHRIKNPRAKRSQYLRNVGKHAAMRRTATGTPVTRTPFDVYAQVHFLDNTFWKREVGVDSYTAFKARYAIWSAGFNNGRKYPVLEKYDRLDELQRVLTKISHRLTKDDAGLDLPPKVYAQRTYPLSPQQRRAYDQLVADYEAELASGKHVEAALALVWLTRLRTIACGYARASEDGEGEVTWIPGDRPRLKALCDILEDTFEPALVWACHREDCRVVTEVINAKSRDGVDEDGQPTRGLGYAVKIDGTVGSADRERAIAAFRAGDARVLVANPATLSEGMTFNEASAAIYYSNSFRLDHRLQSEDRCHRIGQTRSVTIYDILAEDTVDERVWQSLVDKLDLAAQVNGDTIREWLR